MRTRSPHVGDQMELELAGPGRAWLEPWGGRKPRELTRGGSLCNLAGPSPGGLHADAWSEGEEERSSDQLDLFL